MDGWRKREEETKNKHAGSLPGDRAVKLENIGGPWLVQLAGSQLRVVSSSIFPIALLGTAELHFTTHGFGSGNGCFCSAEGGKEVMLSREVRPF